MTLLGGCLHRLANFNLKVILPIVLLLYFYVQMKNGVPCEAEVEPICERQSTDGASASQTMAEIMHDDGHFPYKDEEALRIEMQAGRPRCDCPEPPDWLKPVNKRRIEEGKKWEEQKKKLRDPLSMCKAMSPLSYVGSGITVEPYQLVPIIGLSLHPYIEQLLPDMNTDIILQISSTKRLGKPRLSKKIYEIEKDSQHFSVSGEGTYVLKLNFKKNIKLLKEILNNNILYSSDNYELDVRDKLQLTFIEFTVDIYVHIRREPLPDLYDPGERNAITDKVTVITKTFERYDALDKFVSSIHTFYPNLTIIIADDSEFPKPIKKNHVKYYIMPFREGSFPGKNLALSQVRTKYVLFMDDDMFFTNETNLEVMLEKLEDQNIDMDINCGLVNNLAKLRGLRNIAYNDTQGYCNMGPFSPPNRQVPGYPQCMWGEMFIFFCMAKTAVLRKIGAYPQIVPAAHEEAWIDTIGKAKSAFCEDSSVTHTHYRNNKYDKYRWETEQLMPRNPMAFFENNICYWWSYYQFPGVNKTDLKVKSPFE
uniref:Beta-1,4 N-acetylgalactosaminyltransferase 2-like n=2 Tax=Saccoglossus kowalevskii TaxID=10224 RepID=A0ABM0N0F6_SACKO|nr:PREDICTED: beta-1,4 N-acetylgalactosaminyltransferase 2-like [Saccoglossus kowalevskii]